MKRILYILLLAFGMATIAPVVSLVNNRVAAVYAVDAKAKAQAQREKEKEKKLKEREKAKAKAQKEREKAAAQKKKEQEKAKAAKQKQQAKAKAEAQKRQAKAQAANAKKKTSSNKASKPAKQERELSAAEEKAQYMAQVASIEKNNNRVLAYLNRDISHRLGFWGLVGYSNLFTSGVQYDPTTINPTGFMNKDNGFVGGGGGLGYQLRYKQFLMTAGLEFTTYNSYMELSNQADGTFKLHYGMTPYEKEMTYHYDFTGVEDKILGGFAQIPLLFGMELKSLPIFWQAGVKIGMGVWGKSTISGTMTTIIKDEQLILDLEKMFGHALVEEEPIKRPSTPVNFGLNIAATAEVGVNFDQWIKASPKIRASLFVDYGVLNALNYNPDPSAQDIPMQMMVSPNPLDFPTNSALATTAMKDAKVNPFLVGAKIAVWLELPRKELQVAPMPQKPQPRLGVRAFDEESLAALGGTAIEITEITADKTKQKNSNKQGLVKVGRVPEGQYRVSATKNGYYPSDTILHMVEEFTYDTIQIRMKRIPAPIIYTLCMNIYDVDTKEPIEATVRMTSVEDTVTLYTTMSADDGFVETPLREGDYIAHLSAPGYMSNDDTLHFVRDTFDLFMQHIQEGIKVKIENLFFATNKTYILPQSEQSMASLASFLLQNPGVTIHIIGHTDAVGTDEANQILSEGRANAVRADLIQRGVAPERMTAEGRGEKEPVADNDTEEGRQLNRRVEFIITGTDGADIEQIF